MSINIRIQITVECDECGRAAFFAHNDETECRLRIAEKGWFDWCGKWWCPDCNIERLESEE